MSTEHSKIKRRGGQRSRNGCATCRARRIKCDETKPGCQRCSQRGWTCGGYPETDGSPKWNSSLALSPPISTYAIPFRIPGSQQDRRLLHYFCIRGAEDLSGHMSSDFWTRLVLQFSHDHVPVRQAVVALSCAHQNYITADDNCIHLPVDAMAQYNKAMRSLRKYMSAGIDSNESMSAVIPLICSVIFFCFENTQGNTEAALRHLNSGIAILARHKEDENLAEEIGGHDGVELLEHMLTRLDLQASMFDDDRLPLLRPNFKEGPKSPILNTFTTIDHASTDLTRLQSWLLQFLISNNTFKFWSGHDLPDTLKLKKKEIEEAYEEWNDKFDQLLQAQSTEAGETLSQDSATTNILRIHHHVFQLLLSASFPYNPSVFGGESANSLTLNKVLDLAESTLQSRGARRRSLGAEAGIIPPLFFITMKCTDPVIFRRALTLLLNTRGTREGMFNSDMLAEMAMRFALQSHTPPGTVALEWQAGDALEKTTSGLSGIAKNLGIVS